MPKNRTHKLERTTFISDKELLQIKINSVMSTMHTGRTLTSPTTGMKLHHKHMLNSVKKCDKHLNDVG
jgi:hypothetical protein